MEYIRRIIDDELNKRKQAFNAIHILLVLKAVEKQELQKKDVKRLLSIRMMKKGMDIWLQLKHRQDYS